jgi:hypothetical protein
MLVTDNEKLHPVGIKRRIFFRYKGTGKKKVLELGEYSIWHL